MKKVKNFKLLSNKEQKAVIGGSSSGGQCCNPANDCCYPVFGDPVDPAVIAGCGLTPSPCDFWYSSAGCCI